MKSEDGTFGKLTQYRLKRERRIRGFLWTSVPLLRLLRVFTAVTLFTVVLSAGLAAQEGSEPSKRRIETLLGSSGFSVETIEAKKIDRLAEGKPVFTFIDGIEKASIQALSDLTEEILGRFEEIDPNFLIESFFILPVEKGSEKEVMKEAQKFLMKVDNFVGIPYWSEEYERYFKLIGELEILERKGFEDGSNGIVTEQYMKPFKPYRSLYRYWMEDEEFVYTNTNIESIHYKFVRAVKEENMYTSLFVYPREGALVFYGIGGVKAFTFFGMFKGRLETSFKGRTEAFFKWFHKEFVEPRRGKENTEKEQSR